MRNLKEISKEVNLIETKYLNKITEYTEKAEAAKTRKNAALEEAEKAYKNTKIEEYHKAQEEARISNDAMEMFKSKVADLQKEPILTKEEFSEIREEIAAYLNDMVMTDKDKLRNLVNQIVEIGNREEELLLEGNKLIEHYQKDLLKDPCGMFSKNGEFIPEPNKVKKYKDYSVLQFVKFITSHPAVADLAKKENIKRWGNS